MTKRTTIKDVAKLAGVTPAVVSRVFNNDVSLNIKDETREAVFDAIKELDYKPSSVARTLRTNASNVIGVLVPDIMNPFFAEVIKGIQTTAKQMDYSIILCDTGDNLEDEQKYIDILRSQLAQGVIMASSYIEDEVITKLESSNMKFIMVNRAAVASKAPYIITNDTKGVMMAVEHLVDLGHEKIAHLAGPLYSDTAIRRLEGYRKALKDFKIEFNPDYVIETKYDEETGYAACKKLLELDDRPTAICAANDFIAIGALRALKEAGLEVPTDISLVGYNDIWISSRLAPPLTTVHTPMMEMGQSAMEMLSNLINHDGKLFDERIVCEPHLVVRESTKEIV